MLFIQLICATITYYQKPSCPHCIYETSHIQKHNYNIKIQECDTHCDEYIFGNLRSKYFANIIEHLVPRMSSHESKKIVTVPSLIYSYKEIDTRLLDTLRRLSLEFPHVSFKRMYGTFSLIGYNLDIKRTYNYRLEYYSLKLWLDTLFSRMQPIDLERFNVEADFFVVFYVNMHAVSKFANIHHRNRFTFKMYKSDDRRLMEMAGVDMRVWESDESENMVLGLYKTGRWYKLIIRRFNEKVIGDWMENAHYPHVTVINDSNIGTILYGVKEVILMIGSRNDIMKNTGKFNNINNANNAIDVNETEKVNDAKNDEYVVKNVNDAKNDEYVVKNVNDKYNVNDVKNVNKTVNVNDDHETEKVNDDHETEKVKRDNNDEYVVKNVNDDHETEKVKSEKNVHETENVNDEYNVNDDKNETEKVKNVKNDKNATNEKVEKVEKVKNDKDESIDVKKHIKDNTNLYQSNKDNLNSKNEFQSSNPNNNNLLERFEKLSIDLHENKAYIDFVFAVLTDDYQHMIDKILPGINMPNILVYDPKKEAYFYDNIDIADLEGSVKKMMKRYRNDELLTWPPELKRSKRSVWCAILCVLLVIIYVGTRRMKKYKLE